MSALVESGLVAPDPGASPGSPNATVCAWCKVVLRPGPPPVSHGICEDCARTFEWRSGRTDG